MRAVPPDDDRPPISRPGALSREELIALVERIMRGDGTEEDHAELLRKFEQSVPHPAASDLIYWHKRPIEPTPAEVVDEALAYRPIEL